MKLIPLLTQSLFYLIFTAHCGNETTFVGGKQSPKARTADSQPETPVKLEPDPSPDDSPSAPQQIPPEATKPPLTALTMELDCINDPKSFEVDIAAASPTLKGLRETLEIPTWTADQALPVTVTGQLCQPLDLKRRVVIVVDVSGSMAINDPAIGNSCARLDAVDALLSPAGPEKSYAIVTFSDGVIDTSNGFYNNKAELFKNVSAFSSPLDIICNATGATFYDDAFDRSLSLFQAEPESAVDFQELYFISDGAPSLGGEGIDEARALKEADVTIGGIMLRGTDEILEDQLVSYGPDGKKLFYQVEDATKLAQTLANLADRAENRVIEARFILKGIESGRESSIDILSLVDGESFQIGSINIHPSGDLKGFEFTYFYKLSGGETFTQSSKVLFVH